MMQAIVYFKKGDKQTGNYFLITALKESGYNSEVMYIMSSIYILNELYDEFKQYTKMDESADTAFKEDVYSNMTPKSTTGFEVGIVSE